MGTRARLEAGVRDALERERHRQAIAHHRAGLHGRERNRLWSGARDAAKRGCAVRIRSLSTRRLTRHRYVRVDFDRRRLVASGPIFSQQAIFVTPWPRKGAEADYQGENRTFRRLRGFENERRILARLYACIALFVSDSRRTHQTGPNSAARPNALQRHFSMSKHSRMTLIRRRDRQLSVEGRHAVTAIHGIRIAYVRRRVLVVAASMASIACGPPLIGSSPDILRRISGKLPRIVCSVHAGAFHIQRRRHRRSTRTMSRPPVHNCCHET
jgi:hypothetical protein